MNPNRLQGEGGEPAGQQGEPSESRLTGFLRHLEELRRRLIRAILYLAAGTALCLVFSRRLLGIITATFHPDAQAHLALLQPAEGFIVHLKVAFVSGLFLTSPLWFSELWGFVAPGLYRRERRVLVPVIVASTAAFLVGAGFGYWIVPYMAEYFKSFAAPDIAVSWSLGKYVDLSLQIMLAFGLVFELPLVIYAAARLGLVTPGDLRKHRRYAVIIILIAAAFITPPDVFTMIVLALPLVLLYEVGIIMASLAVRRREKVAR